MRARSAGFNYTSQNRKKSNENLEFSVCATVEKEKKLKIELIQFSHKLVVEKVVKNALFLGRKHQRNLIKLREEQQRTFPSCGLLLGLYILSFYHIFNVEIFRNAISNAIRSFYQRLKIR